MDAVWAWMSGVTVAAYLYIHALLALQPATVLYSPVDDDLRLQLQRGTHGCCSLRCDSVNTMAGHNSRPGWNMWLHAAPLAKAVNLEHLAGLLGGRLE